MCNREPSLPKKKSDPACPCWGSSFMVVPHTSEKQGTLRWKLRLSFDCTQICIMLNCTYCDAHLTEFFLQWELEKLQILLPMPLPLQRW